jgi:hypothetical protein
MVLGSLREKDCIMQNSKFGEEMPRGWMFGGSVLGTVAIGLVLAGMAIYHFRAPPAPPRVVIESPPEIHIVEKPAPPPRLVELKQTPPAAPPPSAKIVAVKSALDGVWRREKYPLPMFQLNQAGNSIAGKYAPNVSGVYPFRDGRILDNSVEFVVTDQVFRVHFRMTMLGPDSAMVEACVTDEDWLSGLANANRMVRTRQQAWLARMILKEAAKMKGKPVSLGIFIRGTSDLKP